ncbi:hypothetical protein [Streptomyces alboniger]|nr:hypothetical protein [Streptomyces alboniger]
MRNQAASSRGQLAEVGKRVLGFGLGTDAGGLRASPVVAFADAPGDV